MNWGKTFTKVFFVGAEKHYCNCDAKESKPRGHKNWWVWFLCCLHAVITLQSKEAAGWGGLVRDEASLCINRKALVAPRCNCMQPHQESMKLCSQFACLEIHLRWRPQCVSRNLDPFYSDMAKSMKFPPTWWAAGLPTQLRGAIFATTLLWAGWVRWSVVEPSLSIVKFDPPANFPCRIRRHQWTGWICRGG